MTGVRGSLHEADWVHCFEALGVTSNELTCIMKVAVHATVDVCAEMIAARAGCSVNPQP